MQCARMQGSTKAATVLDPSPHFANALQINASASPAQILLISGESSINESRQEDRRRKSSWIRRLKPRDVSELSKGGSAEASLEMTYSERGNSCERMAVGSGIVQPGWFLQEKAANRVRARPNLQVESVSEVKRQKTSEQKDSDEVVKRRIDSFQEKTSMVEPAKSTTSPSIALSSNAGFGPWVNFNRKPDTKPESILGSKVIVGAATACTQESSRDSQRNFCSAFTSTNTVPRCSPVSMVVGDVSAPAMFLKSPLSPVHNKIGLPPRPPSQKSPGFHPPSKVTPSASGMGRGGFHQFAQDVQANRQPFETPSNRGSKQSAGVQDKGTNELAEAAVARCFQKPNRSEQSFYDSTKDHGKGSSDCGQQLFASMGNSNLLIRQARPSVVERASPYIAIGQPLVASCSTGAAVESENNRRGVSEDLRLNGPREGMRGPIGTNVPSDGMDLHLTVAALGMEDPKPSLKNGSASMEPNRTSMQSPSGSSFATSTCEKADASVSTSASLPWEMFIETAGTSRKAREQFVEVYNRARDELKNQRVSQRMSRARVKETDSGPKLTLGPGDTASDHKLRRQSLKHEQHLAGQTQTQKRLSTNSDYRTFSVASNPKEQCSISLVESKGPVTTLANDQSGLIRETGVFSKSDTPWKQADNFRLEQSLPEGQPRSNVKTIVQEVQEGTQQAKGRIFSSTSAANTRELASKLCEGNGQLARLSNQLDDRKESASAVCKGSHITFEEHSISRVTEKGVGSRGKPPSKPHVWLQRWHPTGVHNFKGLPDTQVLPSEGKMSDSANHLTFGLKKFKDGDGVGVFGRFTESKNVRMDKETAVKNLKTSPSKLIPSAAAMAIVGTAARQFCSAQPQRKGSFAFWSGFGMQPPRKVEPVQEKGKAKMFLKADVDMPNC